MPAAPDIHAASKAACLPSHQATRVVCPAACQPPLPPAHPWTHLLWQDWLRDEHPAAYARCRYACVEISPVLAALQRRRVAAEGGHGARFSVRLHDAADAVAWEAADVASGQADAGRVGGKQLGLKSEHFMSWNIAAVRAIAVAQ